MSDMACGLLGDTSSRSPAGRGPLRGGRRSSPSDVLEEGGTFVANVLAGRGRGLFSRRWLNAPVPKEWGTVKPARIAVRQFGEIRVAPRVSRGRANPRTTRIRPGCPAPPENK